MNAQEVLQELQRGGSIECNPGDSPYNVEWLSFSDGRYYLQNQNCFSDTCNCVSHPRYVSTRIDRDRALSLIHGRVEHDRRERAERDAEIAWLKQAASREDEPMS